MDSAMEAPSESYTVYNDIVRMCYVISRNEDDVTCKSERMIEMFKKGIDINSVVPHFNPLRFAAPDLIGTNTVHYAFSKESSSMIPFQDSSVFVSNGADFTLKDGSGSTALQLSLGNIWRKFTLNNMDDGYHGIKDALSTHVEKSIASNPVDKYGLTHLHIACMLSHTKVVEYFLKNGSSVHDVIHQNSPFLSGYTALHLAAYFGTFETVELLLKYGADVHFQNTDGVTPLQTVFDRLEMVCRDPKTNNTPSIEKFKKDTSQIIILFLKECCSDSSLACQLCIACVEQSSTAVEKLLKCDVDVDAKFTCLAMTALHFAAYLNFRITHQLLKHGANIFAKDNRGVTPLDICIARYGCRTMLLLPSICSLKNHLICENFTVKVINSAFHDDGKLKTLDNVQNHPDMNTSCILFGSPIWPGFTPLHLVVTFAESRFCEPKFGCWFEYPIVSNGYRIIKYLSSCGADPTRQDASGQTPLHLAFQLKKFAIVNLILDECSNYENNPMSATGLTHFHIACLMGNMNVMKKFIAKKVRMNQFVLSDFEFNHEIDKPAIVFKTGSTSLHIAVRLKKFDIVKLLLEHGADIKLKDATGMTPVHMMACEDFSVTDLLKMMNLLMPYILMCEDFEEYCKSLEVILKQINPIVISTLLRHESKSRTAMLLSESGSDSMKIKNYFKNLKILKLMIDNHVKDCHITADHLLDAFKRNSLEDQIPKRLRIETTASLLSFDWKDLGILDTRSGMTQLHVACAINNIEIVKALVESGADVNCKLSQDSPVFPCYTPLHIAVEFSSHEKPGEEFTELIELLLKYGADPTIQDAMDQTPLHLAYKFSETAIMAILLRSEKVVGSNPVNQLGLSHFHIACSQNSLEIVEKFIKSGVDVNACNYLIHLILWRREQDYVKNCGCTPIQMTSCPKVIELLLSHGADPNMEDYRGWNALHYACKRDNNIDAIKCLISSGKLDINAPTVKDSTPLNFFVKKIKYGADQEDYNMIRFFLEHGAYVKTITFKYALESEYTEVFETLLECSPNAIDIKDGQDTVMHELFRGSTFDVSEYEKHIQKLIKLGLDIDIQDAEGKTPLHIAFEEEDAEGVIGLLNCGADVNIVDRKNEIAFSAGILETATKLYISHIEKLGIFERTVSPAVLNNMISVRSKTYGANVNVPERLRVYLEHEELAKIGNTPLDENSSLYDFLFMKPSQLLKIADNKKLIEIRDSADFSETYSEFGGILKYQMRVAERERLLHLARKSLHTLFKSKLPELCVQHIVVYLKNLDLKGLTSIM